jgi:hypothetical protein
MLPALVHRIVVIAFRGAINLKKKKNPFWIRPNSKLSITKGCNVFQTAFGVRYSIDTMD